MTDISVDRPSPHTGTDSSIRRRFDELEGFRGIAALLVVVFHAYQYCRAGDGSPFAYEGTPAHTVLHQLDSMVSWFFVLSAFLLFLPMAASAADGAEPQSARGFLIRRAIRILPLYWVAIVTVWAFRNRDLPGDWKDLVEHLTFTQVFDEKRIFYTIGPAWSLAVEVMFYLGLAVLGVMLARACRRLRTRASRIVLLAAVPAALAAASIAWKAWAFYIADIPLSHWPTYFGFLAKLDTFAFGMLLAVVLVGVGLPERPRFLSSALGVAAFAVLAVVFVARRPDTAGDVFFHTMSAVAFTLLLASTVLAPSGSRWRSALSQRPLTWLGMVSYSVYLWHEPVLLALGNLGLVSDAPSDFLVTAVVVVAASLLVGGISYWLIEYPTMQLRQAFTRTGRPLDYYSDDPARRRNGRRGPAAAPAHT